MSKGEVLLISSSSFPLSLLQGWRWATRMSTGAWIIKTILGMANLITFGASTRNGPGYMYLQGEEKMWHS
jgi:hypothetical protein